MSSSTHIILQSVLSCFCSDMNSFCHAKICKRDLRLKNIDLSSTKF